MADDKTSLNVDNQPKLTQPHRPFVMPGQVEQQEQQSQATTTKPPERRPAPGRRPLFRN